MVCVCVCVCVGMYVCMYVCVCVCVLCLLAEGDVGSVIAEKTQTWL